MSSPGPAPSLPANNTAKSGFLTTREAGAYLRVSKSYLDKLRVYGGGPTFTKLGKRKIVYLIADLDSWAALRRHASTSEYDLAG